LSSRSHIGILEIWQAKGNNFDVKFLSGNQKSEIRNQNQKAEAAFFTAPRIEISKQFVMIKDAR